MSFCENCGTSVQENVKFCPSCGLKTKGIQDSKTTFINNPGNKVTNIFNNTADKTIDFDGKDIEQNKVMGILAYFSWLVLVPIFAARNSKYAIYHANQGLTLAIFEVAWGIADGIISAVLYAIFASKMWGVYRLLTTVIDFGYLVLVAIAIIGIMNAVNGKAKELPIIGKIRILK